MKKVLLLACLLLVASLYFAATPAHPNWVTFERTSPTTGTIRWSSEPSTDVGYYYFSLHASYNRYSGPAYCDPDWNAPGGFLASMTLESPGIFKLDVVLTNIGIPGTSPQQFYNASDDFDAYVAAVEIGGWTWSAYSSWEPPITLPVELSSFTANLTATNFVNLAWTSQSETNLLGYRVYRSENQVLADAQIITPVMIQATNTSSACTYTHEDHEVQANNTYWYWLESVEFQGGTMHGPTSVLVTGGDPVVPNLPEITSLGNIYPNPFRAREIATVDVNVKAGDVANVTIYNSRGQAVKTTTLNEGFHQLNWNGLDSKGNVCSSGIYFFKFDSLSLSTTKKLVLIK